MKNETYDEKMIFMSPELEKEWQDMPIDQKDFIYKNLAYTASKLCNRSSIEMLCHVVNELIIRINKLENKS